MTPDDKDKPVKLTPEQMKRWKELGWGETPEEFDARLSREQDWLKNFEHAGMDSGFIPSEKPDDTTWYGRIRIKLDWLKSWMRW
jgi:hypothetical protein